MREELSARIALMDMQVVDCNRLPIGRVDDVELALPEDGGPPRVEAVLIGSEALGDRLGGITGRWMGNVSRRLRETPGPTRVDPALIEEVEPLVRLGVAFRDLPHVGALERWLAVHVIEKLPGSGDADK